MDQTKANRLAAGLITRHLVQDADWWHRTRAAIAADVITICDEEAVEVPGPASQTPEERAEALAGELMRRTNTDLHGRERWLTDQLCDVGIR